MTAPRSDRRGLRAGLSRPRLAVAAVLAVLAVVGGVLWALPPDPAPVPASASGSPRSTAPTTAPGAVATTSTAATSEAPTPTATVATTDPPVDAAPATSVPTSSPSTPAAAEPGAAAPPAADPPSSAEDPGLEAQVVDLVNAERATAGCGPVVADAGLAGVARAHSQDMRDRGYFSHTTPEGLSPWDRAAAAGVSGASAENIAQGYADAAAVMAGWMDSPGHRANILDCSSTRLGVGVALGPGGPWWTQLFGR